MRGFGALGASAFEAKHHNPRFQANWQASLEAIWPTIRDLSLTLTGQQNLADTAGEVDNVGQVMRQSVTLDLRYTPFRSLSTSLFVGFTHTELLEGIGTPESVRGRKDDFLRAGARASYAVTRLLSLSVDYVHQRRESNLANSGFDENRLTVVLSAGVPVF